MDRNKEVEIRHEGNHKETCGEGIRFNADYSGFRNDIIRVSETFGNRWNDHLERILIAMHRIEMKDVEWRSIHSAPCKAGRGSKKFERYEITKIVQMNVSERAQTKRTSPIVSASKK